MKKISLSGFYIKLIALVFMLVDHIQTYFHADLGLPVWTNWLGRFVAPIFLYMLVEGYFHTSSRYAYLKRLASGAILMFGINIVHNLLTTSYIHPLSGQFDFYLLIGGNNIFLTLCLFFLLFCLFDAKRQYQGMKKYVRLPLVFIILFLLIFSEGGLYLLPLALVFYFTKNNKRSSILAIIFLSLLFLAKAVFGYVSSTGQSFYDYLTFDSYFMMFPAAILIYAYSGQRGGTGAKWEKQLFYVFYPLHLIIIYIISALLGQ